MPDAAMTTQGAGAAGGAGGQGAQPRPQGTPAQAPGAAAQGGGGGGQPTAPPAATGGTPAGPAGGASTAEIEQLRKEMAGLRKQVSDKEAQVVAVNTQMNKWKQILGEDPDAALQALQTTQRDTGGAAQTPPPVPGVPGIDTESFKGMYDQVLETHGPKTARSFLVNRLLPMFRAAGEDVPDWAAGIVALEQAKAAATRQAQAPAQPAQPAPAQPPAPEAKPARTQVQELLLQRQFAEGLQALAQKYGPEWLTQKRVEVTAEALDIDGVTENLQLTPAEAIHLYFREHKVSVAQAARDLFGEQLEDRRVEVEVQRKLAGSAGLMPLGGGSVTPPPAAPPDAQKSAQAKVLGLLSGGLLSLTPSQTAAPIVTPASKEEWGSDRGPVGM